MMYNKVTSYRAMMKYYTKNKEELKAKRQAYYYNVTKNQRNYFFSRLCRSYNALL